MNAKEAEELITEYNKTLSKNCPPAKLAPRSGAVATEVTDAEVEAAIRSVPTHYAMSRADALKRLNGLAPRIEEHLAKIAGSPASRDVPHWTGEINNWIRQMEEVLPHTGKKTAAEWAARIAEWKAKLGQ